MLNFPPPILLILVIFTTPALCELSCDMSTECFEDQVCHKNKCVNSCTGACGYNTECIASNHTAKCCCLPGHQGDPFTGCIPGRSPILNLVDEEPRRFCITYPCGANAVRSQTYVAAYCSCIPGHFGDPYVACSPDGCSLDQDCSSNKVCQRNKCADPCQGSASCGSHSECTTKDHVTSCQCLPGYVEDTMGGCFSNGQNDPCSPSPCGPNSECKNINGMANCRCLKGHMGSVPDCKPNVECTQNDQCPSDRICLDRKCTNPCPGPCAPTAVCKVEKHRPSCTCPPNLPKGDPFIGCEALAGKGQIQVGQIQPSSIQIQPAKPEIEKDPCNPSPCGSNAICNKGICSCLVGYEGDPYRSCQKTRTMSESGGQSGCTFNDQCSKDKICDEIEGRCVDPCPGYCAVNTAKCAVINHNPVCSCADGYEGNPFTGCRKIVNNPIKQSQGTQFTCPPAEQVSPCVCAIRKQPGKLDRGILTCNGANLKPMVIANALEAFRNINNSPNVLIILH